MTLRLLTEHHLEFLSLKGGCTGSLESTLAKIPNCWKSHVMVHLYISTETDTSERDLINRISEYRAAEVIHRQSQQNVGTIF